MNLTKMTLRPWQLVSFRVLLIVVGPWPMGSKLIRALLLRLIRRKGRIAYVAHADFFDVRQIGLERTPLYVRPSRPIDL